MNSNLHVQFFYRQKRGSSRLRRCAFATTPGDFDERFVVGAPAEIRVWDSDWLTSTRIWIAPIELNGIISEESDSSHMVGAGCPVHAYELLRLCLCFLLAVAGAAGAGSVAADGRAAFEIGGFHDCVPTVASAR